MTLFIPTLIITIIGTAIFLGYIALIDWVIDVVDRWMDRKIDHEK